MKFGETPPAADLKKEDPVDGLLRKAWEAGQTVVDGLGEAARAGKVTPEMVERVAGRVEEVVLLGMAAIMGRSGEVLDRLAAHKRAMKAEDETLN